MVTGGNLGGGPTKTVAFSILLPIGYLLVLSACLLRLAYRSRRFVFHVAFGICLLSVLILDLNRLPVANLELLSIGLLGVLFEYLPDQKIQQGRSTSVFSCAELPRVSYPQSLPGM